MFIDASEIPRALAGRALRLPARPPLDWTPPDRVPIFPLPARPTLPPLLHIIPALPIGGRSMSDEDYQDARTLPGSPGRPGLPALRVDPGHDGGGPHLPAVGAVDLV